MQSSPTDEFVSCLTRLKPATVLADKEGHFWIRWEITRHRLISSVGDDQEQYYQQEYLLQVPLTVRRRYRLIFQHYRDRCCDPVLGNVLS